MNVSGRFLCALVLAVWGMTTPWAVSAGPETISLEGRDYVRLADWARERGLDVRWVKPDKELLVSGPAGKITLSIDSREASFQGVQVWLLFPVARQNGRVYLSSLDVRRTFAPLLDPPRRPSRSRIRTICLDPGHGGRDPGYRVGPLQEKKYTLLLAQELRNQLKRAGFNVFLTRTTDAYVDLPVRPALAKYKSADLLVSLHFNATDLVRSAARGAEVYCLTPAGASSTNARGEGATTRSSPGNVHNDHNLLLGFEVQKSLVRNLATEDRGLRRARFAVLREATMPAILIEAGFLSHPIEGRKILTADYRQKVAKAITDGLLAYQRQVER